MGILRRLINSIKGENEKEKLFSTGVEDDDVFENADGYFCSSPVTFDNQYKIATIDVEEADGTFTSYSVMSEDPEDFNKDPESVLEAMDSVTWSEIIYELEKSIAEDRKKLEDNLDGTV